MHDRRLAADERLQAGTCGEDFLTVLEALGERVRGAGQAELAVGAGQHDSGRVNRKQLLDRDHGLLQGGGQIPLGVQVGQGGDALGKQGRIDGHGLAFLPVAELANPVNRPGNAPWGADQAQQPHMVVVWASADPSDGISGNRPCEAYLDLAAVEDGAAWEVGRRALVLIGKPILAFGARTQCTG
jgi:hypothetical protein